MRFMFQMGRNAYSSVIKNMFTLWKKWGKTSEDTFEVFNQSLEKHIKNTLIYAIPRMAFVENRRMIVLARVWKNWNPAYSLIL